MQWQRIRRRASCRQSELEKEDAAAAYRNLGAIAGLGDPKRAREAYAKALEYDAEDREALYWYGYLTLLAGDLGTAERSLDATAGDCDSAWRSTRNLSRTPGARLR